MYGLADDAARLFGDATLHLDLGPVDRPRAERKRLRGLLEADLLKLWRSRIAEPAVAAVS